MCVVSPRVVPDVSQPVGRWAVHSDSGAGTWRSRAVGVVLGVFMGLASGLVPPATVAQGTGWITSAGSHTMAPASSMVLLDGPSGSMVVGSTTVPVPAVRLVDSGGNGVAGETVTFTVAAGGGRLAPAVIANLDAVYRTGGSTVVTNEAKAVLFTTSQGAVSVSRVAVMFNRPTSTYPASF